MTNNFMKITTIFSVILILILLISGFTFNQVIKKSTNNDLNQDNYYTRKEELLLEQKKLEKLIQELNQTLQAYDTKQNLLLDKLSLTKSANDVAAQKELIAQKNKQVTLETTIPDVVEPVVTTKPAPTPKPTKVTTRAS